MKILTFDGLKYFYEKIKTMINGKVHPVTSNTTTAPSEARVGDYLLNSGTATYTIAGVSTAIGGLVKITALSPLTGVASGNIRGATGTTGTTGANGKGVSSTAITYQVHSSGTTAPTGTWGSSVPSTSAGQFLWTRVIITYTDSTTATFYSVSRNGSDGAQGIQGIQGIQGVKGDTGAGLDFVTGNISYTSAREYTIELGFKPVLVLMHRSPTNIKCNIKGYNAMYFIPYIITQVETENTKISSTGFEYVATEQKVGDPEPPLFWRYIAYKEV